MAISLNKYMDNTNKEEDSDNAVNDNSRQTDRMVPHSSGNSNVKGNQNKPLYSDMKNNDKRTKTPKSNEKIIPAHKDYRKPQNKILARKPSCNSINNSNSKRNNKIQRPMANKLIKPSKSNQRIIIDKSNNNKPKQLRPASANPTSINKRKQAYSTNYQQQHQIRVDKQVENKDRANKAVGGNKQVQRSSNNNQKPRPLSSNPTIHNTKPSKISNTYNSNNNSSSNSNHLVHVHTNNHHSFPQTKTSQKQIDPDHKILVNPIKVIEPVGNAKSYQYKVNYSLPNTVTQSTNQTVIQHPNTNQNPNTFLKRNNIQVNTRSQQQNPPNVNNKPTQLMVNSNQSQYKYRQEKYY